MIPPEPKYTKVGDSDVAYQIVGDGPVDLVYVTGLNSNVDVQWEFPPIAKVLERIASYSRLIMFDRRGSGLSGPIALANLPTWEHWVEDLTSVLDAAGSERAVILGQLDGGFWGMLYAATHPERTLALVLWNAWAASLATEDYALGFSEEYAEAQTKAVSQIWGTRTMAALAVPTYAADDEVMRWIAKFFRSSLTPRAAAEQMAYISRFDIRHVLPSIRVPTLVLHRKDWQLIPAQLVRYVAEHIPNARFAEVPGEDANLFTQGANEVQDLIEDFLADLRHAADPNRVLATVLFTDIVGSTKLVSELGDKKWKELLAEHERLARAQIDRFRGTLVEIIADGLLATFDGPGRAIRCAQALGRALHTVGMDIRAGLHTGEIELREDARIGGIAVHIASRVMGEAGPGEVVCSRTVKDLVAGSEFVFDDRGVCALKGVPDEWQLYSVRHA